VLLAMLGLLGLPLNRCWRARLARCPDRHVLLLLVVLLGSSCCLPTRPAIPPRRLANPRHAQEYDLNTWKGTRVQPNAQEREAIARGELFVPRPEKVKYLNDFATQEQPEEWVQLDSVGATFLYVNSVAHREGVVFTTSYVVGGEWAHEGYDGIESEGICYIARFLGYQCWGLATDFTTHGGSRRAARRLGLL
jgi:hypothetical protein